MWKWRGRRPGTPRTDRFRESRISATPARRPFGGWPHQRCWGWIFPYVYVNRGEAELLSQAACLCGF